MHSLDYIFTQVGTYAKWAEGGTAPIQKYPLFQYPTKIEKDLNRDMKSLSERRVTVCKDMSRRDPLYILNIPFVLPYSREESLSKWNGLISKIRDESFGADVGTSRSMVSERIYAIIGINRVTSISREDDNLFKQTMKELPLEKGTIGFNCQLISTLWKSKFILNGELEIDHQTAQMAFLVLEYLDTHLAAGVRSVLEGSPTFRSHIPYIYIREWIKNAMLKAMESLTPERLASQPIYMATLDSDIVSLRADGQGLFSAYNDIIRLIQKTSHPVDTAPRLMSTGYFASPEESLSTQLAIMADMFTREYINKPLPLAPYFPEPTTCVLVNEVALRALLSFMSKSQKLDTENRRLIKNIRPILEKDQSRILFVARRCLLTTIPLRMKASHDLASFQAKHLGEKQALKSLRGISQTHIDVSILNNNMWIALQPSKSSRERMAFKAPFSQIFACFDPISLANSLPKPISRYSYKCFDFLMKVYPIFINYLWKAFCHRNDPSKRIIDARDWSLEAQKMQRLTPEMYTGAFNGYFEQLDRGFKTAEKELGYTQAVKIVEVARSAGQAIFDVLKANLNK